MRKKSQDERTEEQMNYPMGMTVISGYITIIFAFIYFSFCLYAMIISKFLKRTGHVLLDWIKDDEFFCYLFPLLLPVLFLLAYANWLSLKYFRHS